MRWLSRTERRVHRSGNADNTGRHMRLCRGRRNLGSSSHRDLAVWIYAVPQHTGIPLRVRTVQVYTYTIYTLQCFSLTHVTTVVLYACWVEICLFRDLTQPLM